jgi:uncharacterized protein (DUF433 family)
MTLQPPFDRITIEPAKLSGHPCIRGMRITVRRVLELIATYPDRNELLAEYPDLEEADLNQALEFSQATLLLDFPPQDFTLSESELEAPAKDLPALRQLLFGPSVFDQNQ